MEKLNIPQNLYKQFLCGKYCDLQIQVENSYFRAHSCVVAASSWVLEAILQSSTSEDANLSKLSIQLHGVTAYAISCLLGFIYTGKFPSETYVDADKRTQVLHAAKLYKMDEVPNEFKLSSSSGNGGMSNLQMLESGSLNDSLLENLVPSESDSVSEKVDVEGGTPTGSIEMNVIMSGDDVSVETKDSGADKLSDDTVKDHVVKTVGYAQKHGIKYCVFCGEIFTTETGLIAHMSEHKPGYRKRPERAAASLATFVLDGDDWLDDANDIDYSANSSKKKRTGTGTIKKSFACSECGISYSGKVYLIKHYDSVHPGSLYCKFCAERFDSQDLLAAHIVTHTPVIEVQTSSDGTKTAKGRRAKKTYDCNLCSTSFLKRKELVQHQQNLHGIIKPMHLCTLCGKEFKEKASLRAHTRVHTGEKPYVCSYCGNRFADAKTWKDHERRHRGEKPFLCTTCGKSFTYRQSFTRHMKFHEGKRPFQCSFCGKAFVLRQNLKEHEKRHNK